MASPEGSFQGALETAGGGTLTGHNNACQATKYPVNRATGEFRHSFADLTVPGRGPALDLTRNYSSFAAASDSPFGHGWSSSFGRLLKLHPRPGRPRWAAGRRSIRRPHDGAPAVAEASCSRSFEVVPD